MRSNICIVAFWLLASSTVEAHTWLENIRLIGSNGSFVGALGYPRGYGPRVLPDGKPAPDPNAANVYMLPQPGKPIQPSDMMCKGSQIISNYTADYPRLTAAPLDKIAMRYLENGHVTLVQGVRPAHNGTVFIYGTKSPSDTDTYLGIHRVWNTAGTGGDKRGKLIATRNFDDGKCFQMNGSPISAARQAAVGWTPQSGSDLPCQTDLQIPSEAGTSGTYTLYWVWEWPTLDATTGKVVTNQSYTACLDINMTAKSAVSVKVAVSSAAQQLKGADAALVAVQAQLDSQFLVDPNAPPALTAGPAFTYTMSSAPAAATSTFPVASNTPVISSATSKVSAAPNGFVTVTITQSVHETATVTVTKEAAQATATAVSTHQVSPTHAAPSGIPSPEPFLNGANAIVSSRNSRIKGRRGIQL